MNSDVKLAIKIGLFLLACLITAIILTKVFSYWGLG